eukprot:12797328-Ditylum_brightwellii.AAC.1
MAGSSTEKEESLIVYLHITIPAQLTCALPKLWSEVSKISFFLRLPLCHWSTSSSHQKGYMLPGIIFVFEARSSSIIRCPIICGVGVPGVRGAIISDCDAPLHFNTSLDVWVRVVAMSFKMGDDDS